jgi:THO complex subunit 3
MTLPTDTRISIPANRFHAAYSKARTTAYIDIPPGQRGSSTSRIITLAWAPLGQLVATGAVDKKLRVWNPERATVKHSTELRGHTGSVECVAFNPLREAELASAGLDGSVRVWDVRTKRGVGEVKLLGKEIISLAWASDEEILVGTKDDYLVRISRREGTEIERMKMEVQTNHFAFSHDGKYLFLTDANGSVRIVDYPSFELVHELKAHTSSAYVTALSPTGRMLGVGGTDALVTLWDTQSWHCMRALPGMQGVVRTLSFSWDGGYLVAGGEEDRSLDIVHVDTGETVHKIDNIGSVGAVGWSPKDYSLAYAVAAEASVMAGLRIVNGAGLL